MASAGDQTSIPVLLSLAKWEAAHNRPSFPCSEKKTPLVQGGFKSASKDLSALEKMPWERATYLGIPTGTTTNLLVVDVDVPKSNPNQTPEESKQLKGEQQQWLNAHEALLSSTRTIKTPSGGLHYEFSTANPLITCNASVLAPYIDVRANGGYVCRDGGVSYIVLKDVEPQPLPADLEQELLTAKGHKLISRSNHNPKNLSIIDTTTKSTGSISEGGRNCRLTEIGGAMVGRGEPLAAVRDELHRVNTGECKPPLPKEEVDAIAASVTRYSSINEAIEDFPSVLTDISKPHPPLNSLPRLLGDAINELAYSIQVPREIALQSLLAVSSLAAQGLFNVEVFGKPKPLGLFLMLEAASGDRKSACDAAATKYLETFEREAYREYQQALKIYDRELQDWLEINKKGEVGFPEPIRPINPVRVISDPTIEGLIKALINEYPSRGLFNNEAGSFFGGYSNKSDNILKTMADLSGLWDGQRISKARAKNDTTQVAYDRRLTVSFMVQSGLGDAFFRSSAARLQGVAARFLIDIPESLAGNRLRFDRSPPPTPAFDLLQKRLGEMLKLGTLDSEGLLELRTLRLNNEAQILFEAFYLETERFQGNGEAYEQIRANAAKAPENALRLAGIFSALLGDDAIAGYAMGSAIALMNYYLQVILWDLELSDRHKAKKCWLALRDFIEKQSTKSASARDIVKKSSTATGLRSTKSNRVSIEDAKLALDHYCKAGLLRVSAKKPTDRSTHYEVND